MIYSKKVYLNMEEIKDIIYDNYNDFENGIDWYSSRYKKDLDDTDINIMFEFLDCFIDKIKVDLQDKNYQKKEGLY